MGFSLHYSVITLIIFLSLATTLVLSSKNGDESQEKIKSARLLDLVIRDYTFKSYKNNFKTGKLHRIDLPSNLSGINVDTVRFRCGSLHRHGAKVNEFQLGIGIKILPCVKRVMLVRQNLGSKWSSLYYDNYELSGYKLVSPVLGLLAYNLGGTNNTTSGGGGINISVSSELEIRTGKKPIVIDFSSTKLVNATSSSSLSSGVIALCARFGDEDGKVTLSKQVGPNVCVSTRNGHFGLVVESPLMPSREKEEVMSRWKMVIGGGIGAVLGLFLIGLLMIAVFVKKKKERMEEMVRRAYEEEALQVSMVGHVRAVTASGTRTVPTIEHFEYRPPPP